MVLIQCLRIRNNRAENAHALVRLCGLYFEMFRDVLDSTKPIHRENLVVNRLSTHT